MPGEHTNTPPGQQPEMSEALRKYQEAEQFQKKEIRNKASHQRAELESMIDVYHDPNLTPEDRILAKEQITEKYVQAKIFFARLKRDYPVQTDAGMRTYFDTFDALEKTYTSIMPSGAMLPQGEFNKKRLAETVHAIESLQIYAQSYLQERSQGNPARSASGALKFLEVRVPFATVADTPTAKDSLKKSYDAWVAEMKAAAQKQIDAYNALSALAKDHVNDAEWKALNAFCREHIDQYTKETHAGNGKYEFKRDAQSMANVENAVRWLEVGVTEWKTYHETPKTPTLPTGPITIDLAQKLIEQGRFNAWADRWIANDRADSRVAKIRAYHRLFKETHKSDDPRVRAVNQRLAAPMRAYNALLAVKKDGSGKQFVQNAENMVEAEKAISEIENIFSEFNRMLDAEQNKDVQTPASTDNTKSSLTPVMPLRVKEGDTILPRSMAPETRRETSNRPVSVPPEFAETPKIAPGLQERFNTIDASFRDAYARISSPSYKFADETNLSQITDVAVRQKMEKEVAETKREILQELVARWREARQNFMNAKADTKIPENPLAGLMKGPAAAGLIALRAQSYKTAKSDAERATLFAEDAKQRPFTPLTAKELENVITAKVLIDRIAGPDAALNTKDDESEITKGDRYVKVKGGTFGPVTFGDGTDKFAVNPLSAQFGKAFEGMESIGAEERSNPNSALKLLENALGTKINLEPYNGMNTETLDWMLSAQASALPKTGIPAGTEVLFGNTAPSKRTVIKARPKTIETPTTQDTSVDVNLGSPEVSLGAPEQIASIPDRSKQFLKPDDVEKTVVETRNRSDEAIRAMFRGTDVTPDFRDRILAQFKRYEVFDDQRSTFGGYEAWEICRQECRQAFSRYSAATLNGIPNDMKRRRDIVESIDAVQDALDAYDAAIEGKEPKERENPAAWNPEVEKNITWQKRSEQLTARQAELKDTYGSLELFKQFEKTAWQYWSVIVEEGKKQYPDTKLLNVALDQVARAQHYYAEQFALEASKAAESTEVASADKKSLFGLKLPTSLSGLAQTAGINPTELTPEMQKAAVATLFSKEQSESDIRKTLITTSKMKAFRKLSDDQVRSLLYLKAHLPAAAGKDGVFNAADIDAVADSIFQDVYSRPLDLYLKILQEKGFHPQGREAMGLRKALGLEAVMTQQQASDFNRGLRMERSFLGRIMIGLSGKGGELQNAKVQLGQLEALKQSLPGEVRQNIANNLRKSLQNARVSTGWGERDTGHGFVSEGQMRDMEKHTEKLREISRLALTDVRDATGAEIESYSPNGLSVNTIDWMLDAHTRPNGRPGSPPESAFWVERKTAKPDTMIAQKSSPAATSTQVQKPVENATVQNSLSIPGVSINRQQREIRVPVTEAFTITYNPNPSNIPPTYLKPDRVFSLQGIAVNAWRYSDLWVLQVKPGFENMVTVTRDSDGTAIRLDSVQQTRNSAAPSPEGRDASPTPIAETTAKEPTSVEKIRNGKIIDITSEEQFMKEVLQSDIPVIVDFTATWCGPCNQMKPYLEKVAQDRKNDVKIVALDVDRFPAIRDRYQLTAYPTLVVHVAGNEVNRKVGLIFDKAIERLIPPMSNPDTFAKR